MSLSAIGRRALTAIATALAVWLLVTGLLALAPGDPVDLMLGEQARPAAREALRARLGLDRPWLERNVAALTALARGDLGDSIWLERPVAALVGERIGPTAALAVAAMLVAWGLALPPGIAGGWSPGSRIDRFSRWLAVATWSTPAFALGPLLLIVFGVRLGRLPLGGYAIWSALVLPATTLGLGIAGLGLRLVRDGVAAERSRPHVTAARARGVTGPRLLLRHGLRPAIAPVVQIAALQFGALLAGAVIVETVCRWPGLGRLLVQAVGARDLPLVQGLVVVMSFGWIGVNLLADLAARLLDPRSDRPA